MHINGNSMAVNQADMYSAAQGERATAAERAAEVRKKLLKSAGQIEGSTPEETLMISQWLDSRHSQTQSAAEYRVAASGRDPDFD